MPAAAALSFIGCGGNDGADSAKQGDQSSLLQKPVATTKQAVAGGNFSDRIASDDNYYLYDSNFNTSGNPGIGEWLNFRLYQPWVGNFDSFVPFIIHPAQENTSQLDLTYRWFDKSKKRIGDSGSRSAPVEGRHSRAA